MSNDDREARILRDRRTSLGLTQGQVATEAGIEMRAYQRYGCGEKREKGNTEHGRNSCEDGCEVAVNSDEDEAVTMI